MVKKLERSGRRYYVCEVCSFAYAEKKWADACEKSCTEQHGCSLEITQHAVEMPKDFPCLKSTLINQNQTKGSSPR